MNPIKEIAGTLKQGGSILAGGAQEWLRGLRQPSAKGIQEDAGRDQKTRSHIYWNNQYRKSKRLPPSE